MTSSIQLYFSCNRVHENDPPHSVMRNNAFHQMGAIMHCRIAKTFLFSLKLLGPENRKKQSVIKTHSFALT
jgi:hypothetical protein